MKKALLSASAIFMLFLSGCSSMEEPENQVIDQAQAIDVLGKVQVVPFMSGDDGDVCAPGLAAALEFNGQQVKLLNAEGAIVGLTNLKGWTEPREDIAGFDPAKYGYYEKNMCTWDFSFPGVTLDSNFYSLEFTDRRVSTPTLSKAELERGPVIVLD